MGAIARDLYLFCSCVFAALAAVLFALCYGTPAWRMRTFLVLEVSHNDFPFR
jgi:hypothetical protein